jgi:run domain Beclin-1 interacting cysteine-rich containing protein
MLSRKASGFVLGRRSGSSLHLGLLSGLFSKAHPEKMKDEDTIILMGSLPTTSL